VDPLTHALSSFALQRGFFSRAGRGVIFGVLIAGTISDLDWFTAALGPSSYFALHRTITHSLVGCVVIAMIAALLADVLAKKLGDSATTARTSLRLLFVAALASSLLHLLLDLCQADGVALLWPFSPRRFALDLLPGLDLWLLVLFALAILLPELFRLVSDEIGARAKRPRGRNGAIIGFVLALAYLGMRTLFHGNVVATLNAHTIAGEVPRRVAAFPDSSSPFLWHAIVETERSLHLVTERNSGGEVTDASYMTTLRKPEPSEFLQNAQKSPAAVAFLKAARFPKATVQKETDGYAVEIVDLKNQASGDMGRAILVDINLDPAAKVRSSELQWQKAGPVR